MSSLPITATELRRSDFPKDFVFGAATAAYQILHKPLSSCRKNEFTEFILLNYALCYFRNYFRNIIVTRTLIQVEGAANLDGRAPSLWDVFAVQNPQNIDSGSNGNVAVDQYHRYKEDVASMKKIGLDAYRFSISWSRVLPGGRLSAGVNKKGVEYYNNLIDELKKNDIEPYVTIFHWDVPQALEAEYGGFLSDQIIKDFREFADLCFWEFGDRVKHWITLNEPWSFATGGYAGRGMAPGRGEPVDKKSSSLGLRYQIDEPPKYRSSPRVRTNLSRSGISAPGDSGTEPYIVAHNLILAHAEAYHLYKDKYKGQGGKVGITLVSQWYVPFDATLEEDKQAKDRALDFFFGWFMSPITNGKYPQSMIDNVKKRLPTFKDEDSERIKMSYDFLGLNYYTARYAQNIPGLPPSDPYHYDTDIMVNELDKNSDGVSIGPQAGSAWLYVNPSGIYDLLRYVKKTYGNPVIYITENGYDEVNQDKTITLPEAGEDPLRISYIKDHLHYIKKAIVDKKVNVKGYFYWSLIDNYEWGSGYTVRFGLIYADYLNGLARYPKKSALWYMNLLDKRNKKELPALEPVKTLVGTKRPNSDDADETPVQKQSRGM